VRGPLTCPNGALTPTRSPDLNNARYADLGVSLFRLFSKTIAVAFIDDRTGAQIAVSNVPPEQLPDSFALDTELDLAGSHYVVVRAEPQTKSEFSKSKRLTVMLRHVETVNPQDVLFSMPSICGAALPAAARGLISGEAIVLREDDWRQCEFVATAHSTEVSAELSAIRHIHSNAAASVGWKEIHVRERIAHPLAPGTTWSMVAELIESFEPVGVAFGQKDNAVANAVGAKLPDQVVVWGVVDSGQLTVLCVENLERASPLTATTLRRVADNLSLALVDWCRCRVHCRDVVISSAAGAIWSPVA